MLLSNNNETSKLSIEDVRFGCKVQLWVCTRGSKHRGHFCSNNLCGVQTDLASLLCLLSSGLLSMLKRNMSDYGEGPRGGETTGQWNTKASHHFSLWSINNPCVNIVSGLQESNFFGFHYPDGQMTISRLLNQTLPAEPSSHTVKFLPAFGVWIRTLFWLLF